jgi:hypothetical protein
MSTLTYLSLFYKSGLLSSFLQFFSSSVCLAGLLCINFFFHSALLLLFLSFCSAFSLSVILLCFCSAFHLTLHISKSHTMHLLIFPFLPFHCFLMRNSPPYIVCLVFFYTHLHDGSTSQLLRQKEDNCPSK